MTGIRTGNGNELRRRWGIPARQVRFHKDGTFFMPLTQFPGALADPHGYVVFENEYAFTHTAGVRVGNRVNVKGGIWDLPGYVRAV
jgi:hypothetical protein